MSALLVTYADWTTRPRGESTQPDLAGMGLTSSVGPLLTTATLPQARQAPHHRPACPRCTISQAAAVWFRASTTDIAIKYYATNQLTSQNAEALPHGKPSSPGSRPNSSRSSARSNASAHATGSTASNSTTVRFVDTNILLYATSRDPKEQGKAARANDILTARDVALSVQVLQEFYVQATRASRPDPLSHEQR
jgi:hypothetical protein